MQQPSEQVKESRASGVDETAITKEQLASAVAELSSSVKEFIDVASAILIQIANERKANEDADTEQ